MKYRPGIFQAVVQCMSLNLLCAVHRYLPYHVHCLIVGQIQVFTVIV